MSEQTVSDGATVAMRGPQFDDDTLLSIKSFDDALSLASQELGEIADVGETLGNGFAVLENKDALIDVPCLFLSWNFNNGDFGEFVSAMVVARSESGGSRKVILNDGSTGIFQQLEAYTKRTGKMGGLIARHGLTRSDYDYTDDKGQVRPASTYYINTAA